MPCTTESPKYRDGEFGNSEHSWGEAVKQFRVKVVEVCPAPLKTSKYIEGGLGNSEHSGEVVKQFRVKV